MQWIEPTQFGMLVCFIVIISTTWYILLKESSKPVIEELDEDWLYEHEKEDDTRNS